MKLGSRNPMRLPDMSHGPKKGSFVALNTMIEGGGVAATGIDLIEGRNYSSADECDFAVTVRVFNLRVAVGLAPRALV
ncbi:hypothetical protein [Bosea psychrotolerans]|uniref:hypothetical protein n=1 Tax=Bosea psychrotolerans TaxID=1871628 RepID=UPI0011B0EB28|nr:hypothetical protein [Bosea psychrotolerans]